MTATLEWASTNGIYSPPITRSVYFVFIDFAYSDFDCLNIVYSYIYQY